jgi:hypothetical protein
MRSPTAGDRPSTPQIHARHPPTTCSEWTTSRRRWRRKDAGTGQGEAFIRAGVGRQIAAHVAAGGELSKVALRAIEDLSAVGGSGGLIAIDAYGSATAPFSAQVMPPGIWRAGADPIVEIGPTEGSEI